ncbi:hypothetical protein K456DRAFT_656874 [Colletotrichum gloeosporioides 23]|nr:hypothetical protein K456DRAFT_656874 [Colletotrichum gloeosporioides 23]
MSTPEEQAVAFKNQGNKAFSAHDWPTAIEFYTKAIELNDKEPTFFTNRAQANLKSEAYGYAIADCTKAIELNPKFVKVRASCQQAPGINSPMLTSRRFRHTSVEVSHTQPFSGPRTPS